MKTKASSTFDREMKDSKFKALFDKRYNEFLLSELMLAIMDEDEKSVRQLAKEAKLSPTAIQKMRSGKQNDIKMKNFIIILQACGYDLYVQKKGKTARKLG